MAESDQQKWDQRYARDAQRTPPTPAPWLAGLVDQLPRGDALDLACGRGGNAIYLASRGCSVDAIDISPVGLQLARDAAQAAGEKVNFFCQDLSAQPDISAWQYDLIVMFHFMAPALLARLHHALRPGGVLMVEQHLRGYPDAAGPGSDRFRVAPGALAQTLNDLEIIWQEEGLLPQDSDRKNSASALIPLDTPERSWTANGGGSGAPPFALSRVLARRLP
ncbi:MAG: class I SAM-dependent methyltransferase [Pseudomonadaceae bacterium]|nr:class I SAM-dependent methyltransferase [Pseudomonadaceae bacterium]